MDPVQTNLRIMSPYMIYYLYIKRESVCEWERRLQIHFVLSICRAVVNIETLRSVALPIVPQFDVSKSNRKIQAPLYTLLMFPNSRYACTRSHCRHLFFSYGCRDVQASSILLDDKYEVRLGSLSEVCTQQGDGQQTVFTRMLRSSQ